LKNKNKLTGQDAKELNCDVFFNLIS